MEKKAYAVRITHSNIVSRYGTGQNFVWHLCRKPDPKNPYEVLLASHGFSCREGLISLLGDTRQQIPFVNNRYFGFLATRTRESKLNPGASRYNGAISWAERYEKVTDEVRKPYTEETEKMIEKGARFLNLFEKEADWPLTKVHPVVIATNLQEILNEEVRIIRCNYYLKSSVRWARSPQFISLLILLLRNGAYPVFPEFKSAEEVMEASKAGKLITGRSSDRSYLKTVLPVAVQMMKDWKKVFPGHRSSHWDYKTFNSNFIANEGMSMLLRGSTKNRPLKERFSKLRKQWASEARAKSRIKTKEKQKEAVLQAGC